MLSYLVQARATMEHLPRPPEIGDIIEVTISVTLNDRAGAPLQTQLLRFTSGKLGFEVPAMLAGTIASVTVQLVDFDVLAGQTSMLPVTVTPEMIEAGEEIVGSFDRELDSASEHAVRVYQAMWHARSESIAG